MVRIRITKSNIDEHFAGSMLVNENRPAPLGTYDENMILAAMYD